MKNKRNATSMSPGKEIANSSLPIVIKNSGNTTSANAGFHQQDE